MSQFKFSVITVVKNDQENIVKTLKSVLSQKKQVDLEYIVIDGNSLDETVNQINKFKNEIDLFITENDMGIYDAMNKGIENCSGDIVSFCNSGDIIKDKGLKKIENIFKSQKCDFVFGTVIRNYLGGQIQKFGYNSKRIYYNFDFATSHSTGFYVKKNVINEIGKFDLKYKCSSDYDFYYKMINSNNYKGSSTSKNDVIGEVASGGYSSRISFFGHLFEETKIRINNKQNRLIIFLIFINAIIKHIYKKIFN
jgi:glycosyltransferase involved in cell wall biosynthesis